MDGQASAMVTQQRLDAISPATLTPLVQSASNSLTAIITQWSCSQLQGGVGGGTFGTAIYRFEGECHDQENTITWSFILKVLYPIENQHPAHSHYWKREVHAYQSGWLTNLSGTLVAPRCFGVVEYPEACWLWLEDVIDARPGQWTVEDFGTAARHLGEFNGAYLTAAALPDWPWLSIQWIRQDVAQVTATMTQLHAALEHPLVRRLLPDQSANKVLRLWEERETFLEVLERLPQTLCHFDAFRRNLFIRNDPNGQPQTVAIDWAFAGIAPIGAELVSLVWVSQVFGETGPKQAHGLDQHIFENYVVGLRAAGWSGDPRLPRLGFTAAVGLRRISTIGGCVSLMQRGEWPQEYNDALEPMAACGLFIEELVDEARGLMNTLSLTYG